jgi:hypothetical protein
MVRLTRTKARKLLAAICASDPRLCVFIKILINLKNSGQIQLYSYDDLVTLSRTTVADGVTMGNVINQLLTCGPNNPYSECNSG